MTSSDSLFLGDAQVRRTIKRLACEIVERNRGLDNVLIVGIENRGVAVADYIANALSEMAGRAIVVHPLDVRAFRDDTSGDVRGDDPVLDVDGADVVLVDDVLYTGRTVRAALDALVKCGRPSTIQLAVLVDRGHREYPIRPDYVGRVIETSYRAHVRVQVEDELAIHVLDE